jgi:hypothetical protein
LEGGALYELEAARSADERVALTWQVTGGLAYVPSSVWTARDQLDPYAYETNTSALVPLVSMSLVPSLRLSGSSAPFGVLLFGSLTGRNAISNDGYSVDTFGANDVETNNFVAVLAAGLRFDVGHFGLSSQIVRSQGRNHTGESQTGLAVSGSLSF